MEFELLSFYELRSAYLCSSDFDINKTVSLRELQLTGHFSFSEMVVRENTSKQAVSEKPRPACLNREQRSGEAVETIRLFIVQRDQFGGGSVIFCGL